MLPFCPKLALDSLYSGRLQRRSLKLAALAILSCTRAATPPEGGQMRISSRSARTLWAKASQESISIHNAFISCPFHHATICSRRIVIRLDYHPGCRAFLDRLRWTLQQRGGRAGMRLPRQTRGYRASSVINVDAAVVLVDGSCHRCHFCGRAGQVADHAASWNRWQNRQLLHRKGDAVTLV